MPALRAYMFGRFCVQSGERVWHGPEGCKAQELFCYMLVHRAVRHKREHLASVLWGDSYTAQSKKYLRQALWQLNAACEAHLGTDGGRVMLVDLESVQVNPEIELWTDVADFEEALGCLRDGGELDEQGANRLRGAAQIYRGDLLEGWYQDWCLYDRERLQNMYLLLLDKLIDYCTTNRDYESGVDYCLRVLHLDPAHERTHQKMMRLLYLSGDRTGALRQYDRCVEALKRELDVGPSRRTLALCEQIRLEQLDPQPPAEPRAERGPASWLPDLLLHLRQLDGKLADLQCEVRRDIRLVEQLSLKKR